MGLCVECKSRANGQILRAQAVGNFEVVGDWFMGGHLAEEEAWRRENHRNEDLRSPIVRHKLAEAVLVEVFASNLDDSAATCRSILWPRARENRIPSEEEGDRGSLEDKSFVDPE